MKENESVKVYYDKVFVSVQNLDEAYEVHANCPYVEINREDAVKVAEFNLQTGIWDSYLIPELLPKKAKILYNQ